MKVFLAVLSLLFALASASHVPAHGSFVAPRSDASLAQFLLAHQGRAEATNPAFSAQCFSIYLPLLQEAADQFAVNYNDCVGNATEDRSVVAKNMQEEQELMSTDAEEVCTFVKDCQAINETLDFFHCFANFGTNSISNIYTISNNASDFANYMVQTYEIIDNNMYKCTNGSERTYVEQTAKVYDALDTCLVYGPPQTTTQIPETTATGTTNTPVTATATPTTTVIPPNDEDSAENNVFAARLSEAVKRRVPRH